MAAQFVAHVLAQLEVEGRKRLVEQEHLRARRKRAGDGDPLVLAAGKFAHQLVALTGQGDEAQQLVGLRGALLARSAPRTRRP